MFSLPTFIQFREEAAVESKAGSEIEYEDVTSTVAKLQEAWLCLEHQGQRL